MKIFGFYAKLEVFIKNRFVQINNKDYSLLLKKETVFNAFFYATRSAIVQKQKNPP